MAQQNWTRSIYTEDNKVQDNPAQFPFSVGSVDSSIYSNRRLERVVLQFSAGRSYTFSDTAGNVEIKVGNNTITTLSSIIKNPSFGSAVTSTSGTQSVDIDLKYITNTWGFIDTLYLICSTSVSTSSLYHGVYNVTLQYFFSEGRVLTLTPGDGALNVFATITNSTTTSETILTKQIFDDDIISLGATNKSGYIWKNWSDGNSANPRSITVSSDITLTANFNPITYSVSYNSNGGSGSINNTTVTYDNYYSNNILAENTFTKFGYNFKEWNTKTDGSGTGYASGSILSDNLTTVQNAVIPLYAIWKKKPLVMFDTIFSFIDWKRQGIVGNNATVSKDLITDIGFTLTSNTGTGEGTAASHYFPVTAGQSYKIDIDIEGNNWDVYIFFHNEISSGTGIDFNDRNNRYSSTDTNSSYQIFKAPDTATKAQIRVDANGSNNTVKFSNFRIYPSNYYHMNNSILANERTIMDNWDFPDNPLRSDVFEFIGWNTSPDGQGDNYDINSTFPENEDKILYSQ